MEASELRQSAKALTDKADSIELMAMMESAVLSLIEAENKVHDIAHFVRGMELSSSFNADTFWKLIPKIDEIQFELAKIDQEAMGRVKKLYEIDPIRWPLEGEYKTNPWQYRSDNDVSYTLATYLFDKYGVLGRWETPSPEFLKVQGANAKPHLDRVRDLFGDKVAQSAWSNWLAGTHDT